jgi:DNA gyrase subunit A
LIRSELEGWSEKIGDARRTKVVGDDEAPAYDRAALVKKEDTHVIVSRDGRLKRVTRLGDPTKIKLRDEDALLAVVQGSSVANVAFFTDQGKAYVMAIHDVPQTAGFGEPVQKFFGFADGEKVVAALSLDPRLVPAAGTPDAALLVATAQGNVLRAPLDPHREPSTRAGRMIVKLGEGDEVAHVELPVAGAKDVLLAGSDGMALRAPLEEVPLLAGAGKGKRGIALGKKARLLGATTRPDLPLETTRGAIELLKARDLARGELGSAGETVKQRGGWTKAVVRGIELVDLGGDGAGEEG